MLRKLYEDEEPEWIGISFDLPGPTFRHEEYTEYKAHRRKMDDDLAVQLPYVRRVCDVFRLPDRRRARLRGRRRDRDAGPPGRGAGLQGRRGLGRQGPAAARDRRRPRPEPRARGRGRRRSTTARRSRRSSACRRSAWWTCWPSWATRWTTCPACPGIGEKGARDLVREFGSLEEVLENAEQGEARGLPRGADGRTATTRSSRSAS